MYHGRALGFTTLKTSYYHNISNRTGPELKRISQKVVHISSNIIVVLGTDTGG